MNKIILSGVIALALAACKSETVYETTSLYACEVQGGVLDCDPSIHVTYPDGTTLFIYEWENGKVICFDDTGAITCIDEMQNPINGVLVVNHNGTNKPMSKTWFKNGTAVLDRHYTEDGFMWLETDYNESTLYYAPGVLKRTVRIIDGKRVTTNYGPNGKDIESVETQDL